MYNHKLIKYKLSALYGILALITLLVYLPSRSYPFQFDDLPNILNYAALKFETFRSLFFTHSRWFVTWINCLIYQHYDSSPIVCRLINIAIHLTNGALVFWLCLEFKHQSIKNNYFLAILTTLFFLLHPVQTQTVSYIIQGQLEGLASLFILLTIVSFIYYTRTQTRNSQFFGIFLILNFLLLASSCKEIAIITPVLILLCDWFWLSPHQATNNIPVVSFKNNLLKIKDRLKLYLLLFSLTLSIYIYYLKPIFFWKLLTGTQTVQFNTGNLLVNTGSSTLTQYQFLISQFKVICHYLQIFIWPLNICVEYDWQLCSSFWNLTCILPFLFLTFFLLLIYYLLKKDLKHPAAFGLIWFLICILPRASIIASGELLVDYKTYLACFGLLFSFAYFIDLVINKFTKPATPHLQHHYPIVPSGFKTRLIVTALLTMLLASLTYQRNLVWSNATAFWHDVIIKAPQKARGFNNYGMALLETDKPQQAIYYFKQALKLNKQTELANFYWDPYQNLANAYALTGQVELAIATIKQALKFNPNIAELQNNLGALLLHQQDYLNSIKHLEIALALKPNNGQTLYTLGKACLALNQIPKAWHYLDRACRNTHLDRIEPVLELYSEISIKLQKLDSAIWALKKLLASHPKHLYAWLNLAGAYYFKKDYPAAKNCYQQILLIEPRHQVAQDRLHYLEQILSHPNIS